MNKSRYCGLLLVWLAGCVHQSTVTQSQGHIGSGQEASPAATAPADIPKPIKKSTYLPAPKPKAKEQTYSVVVNSVPVQEILFALARESKMNVDVHPGITGNVTINAVDQTLPAILERVSKQVDLRYKVEGNTLTITPDIPTLRTYKVNYVNMDRDTDSTIGVAAEIASTGVAANAGAGAGAGGAGGGAGGGGGATGSGNNSNTKVNSKSKNNFWPLLTQNVENILRSTRSQAAMAQETNALMTSAQEALEQTSAKTADAKDAAAQKQAKDAREELLKIVKEQASTVKSDVVVNPVAGTVTVMATERQHGFIQQYLDMIGASAQRQVLIEATIVEVQLNDSYQFGIDWNLAAGNFNITQLLNGQGSIVKAIRDGVVTSDEGSNNQFLGVYRGDNLTASLRALETFGDAQVLSSPKMMAMNNQTSILKVVDNLVYFTVRQDVVAGQVGQRDSTAVTSTPHTVPIGVVMSVTPQISENGEVTLIVRPTISRKKPGKGVKDPALTNVDSFIPEIQVREMESVLQVSSGQTIVLGGLMQDEVTRDTDAVPGLSRLPLVGELFKGRDNSARKSELVIFLKPTVIKKASLDSAELQSFKQFLPENLPPLTTDEPAN